VHNVQESHKLDYIVLGIGSRGSAGARVSGFLINVWRIFQILKQGESFIGNIPLAENFVDDSG